MSELQNPFQRQRCECHDCTQLRGRTNGNDFYTYRPGIQAIQPFDQCKAPCCQPGYCGDCVCAHGNTTVGL